MQISVYSISFGFSWGPIGKQLQRALVIACVCLLVGLLSLWSCSHNADDCILMSASHEDRQLVLEAACAACRVAGPQ